MAFPTNVGFVINCEMRLQPRLWSFVSSGAFDRIFHSIVSYGDERLKDRDV
jgi:hypothetical protein